MAFNGVIQLSGSSVLALGMTEPLFRQSPDFRLVVGSFEQHDLGSRRTFVLDRRLRPEITQVQKQK
jgi:hypothetical protein